MTPAAADSGADVQHFALGDRVWRADDPDLQAALAAVYDTPERPRCLCRPGGIEMYIARHRYFVVKRMPETGCRHHPGCPSFEPEPGQSGLGELVGSAVLESAAGGVELRVDFPWARRAGRGVVRGEPQDVGEVAVPPRRLSLRALTHFLFERAGFNRWSPAMAGKRNQAVLRKYLLAAAEDVVVKGVPLAERLFVPEAFSEAGKLDAAQRRREKLAVLRPKEGGTPLALVIGEFKACEATAPGRRIWLRHLPDAPLLIAAKAWERMERVYAALFEARDADSGHRVRLVLTALIRARREYTYEIDAASLMMTSEQWIPVDGVHELPLIDALVAQGRRFMKPLRYDARSAAAFPNALLLDAGPVPVALHVVSPFMDAKERPIKERSISNSGAGTWVWCTEEAIPPFAAAASRL